jgi:hypothetical protein
MKGESMNSRYAIFSIDAQNSLAGILSGYLSITLSFCRSSFYLRYTNLKNIIGELKNIFDRIEALS